jgi:hypothetical protein
MREVKNQDLAPRRNTMLTNEQNFLIELLKIIEIELNFSFSSEEQKILMEYLANNPQADPAKIMAEIVALAEKKLQKKLEQTKIKDLQNKLNKTKLFTIRTRPQPISWLSNKNKIKPPQIKPPKKDEEFFKRIIKDAEKKLIDERIIKRELDDQQVKDAAKYYQTYAKDEDSPLTKANIALLGVINFRVTGGIRPVVLQSWGNLLNIPDVNPNHGDATIDAANKLKLTQPDKVIAGELNAISNVLQKGVINSGFIHTLKTELKVADDGGMGKKRMPTPSPYGNPMDPFD